MFGRGYEGEVSEERRVILYLYHRYNELEALDCFLLDEDVSI